ncbi:related to glucan 1,3-beta-glucosidase [Rhynchosporium graminicola]|uniref:glucan 1,3-beta-glucosidase n=1 Tax=Rhynchosporium graminicola TaxID=2792576 RepID=A0A1E1KDQ6_9HELO|nr:related to glucan 1,3-beta-glucosidase [Rhynchosporium commune]
MPPPPRESPRRPRESRESRERSLQHDRKRTARRSRYEETSSGVSSQTLSVNALAKLDQLNRKEATRSAEVTPTKPRRKRQHKEREAVEEKIVVEKRRQHKRKKRRVVSGALLEEGNGSRLRGIRGGDRNYEKQDYDSEGRGGKKKKLWLWIGIAAVVVLIIIIVAVVVSQKRSAKSGSPSSNIASSGGNKPSNSNLGGISESDIPAEAKGTDLDPFSWYDTSDFNVTYTAVTVAGLPIMGLNSEFDDSKSANSNTPPISKSWGSYADKPARGVNVGGWLSLEPFITPSLFNYPGVVDEWTLTEHLGTGAKAALEKHYATFVTEQTFKDIAAAGLDHVRIPFSYWALGTYEGDPYVARVSWRYLLRGIEWARKHGLRINLDLHGIPGSQNGWNHSGRLGEIGWLYGPNGALNANRSLTVHDQLSQFFAQPRYQNIVTFYGLANEPKMTALKTSDVLAWTISAYELVRKNGIKANVVIGDGFMGLGNWKGQLSGYEGLVLDVHQYVIFNKNQIDFTHTKKINYACSDWTTQTQQSMDVATGFGPTLFAEWSQADTDCAPNLNNVGWGTRWEGTYKSGDPASEVLSPGCPAKSSACSCANANSDPGTYSAAYKQFLQMFAEAQMHSFEKGWGWFYWTWKTEGATQWSYERGLAAGILPKKAYAPEFTCSVTTPDFKDLPEYYR